MLSDNDKIATVATSAAVLREIQENGSMRCLLITGLMLSWLLFGEAGQAKAEVIYAITVRDTFISFDSSTPGTLINSRPVTGLQAGETLQSIDFDPNTGRLYAISSLHTLYTVDLTTGVVTPVSTLDFLPQGSDGFDFNPVTGRLRIVNFFGENLRINAETGETIVDDPLAYAAADPNAGRIPRVDAIAYTSNIPGATSTLLYGIDFDTLVLQDPDNAGVLTTIGPLGAGFGSPPSFDVSGVTGVAYASTVTTSVSSDLYTVNLGTGEATRIGGIGGGNPVRGLSAAGATPVRAGIPLTSADIGEVGVAGNAAEDNGVWTITASGSDIWRDADSFHFLYTKTFVSHGAMTLRVDDLTNTNPFAKSGLMLRTSLDPGAATLILDVKPNGEVEFMSRSGDDEFMVYQAGVVATTPIWLRLSWSSANGGEAFAEISTDGVHFGNPSVGPTIPFPVAAAAPNGMYAGVAVTSHDNEVLTTSHVQGFSLLPYRFTFPNAASTAIGAQKPGSALYSIGPERQVVTVEGAGADVWGTADSFQYVYGLLQPDNMLLFRVVSLENTNPFAKAGLMIRDSLEPGAPSVILDAKPSGEVEFMARLCYGCETTYISGTAITFPAYLRLTRSGDTFIADVSQDLSAFTRVGTVDVKMNIMTSPPYAGFAVTSHDANRTTTAVFDLPVP